MESHNEHSASQGVTRRFKAFQGVSRRFKAFQGVSRRHSASQCVTVRHSASQCVTVRHSAFQVGIGLQDRVKRGLVMSDDRPGEIAQVPISSKRENFPDRDDKKARLSDTIRRQFFTPSSCIIGAKASRSRARFFRGITKNRGRRCANPATTDRLPNQSGQPRPRQAAPIAIYKILLGRRNEFIPSK
jgi:hypothetical protein